MPNPAIPRTAELRRTELRRPELAYIALGSNLGEREQHLARARERIAAVPGVAIVAVSQIEETAPLGEVPQGAYLNQMIAVRTTLSPPDLLAALLEIEQQGGRIRDTRWGPRTIDLDIVRYEQTEWNDAQVTIPHPEFYHRDFWQREFTELQGYTHHE